MGMKNKRVLITGISGFTGSYLAEHLLTQGAEVYGLIRKRADGTAPKNLVDKAIYKEVRLTEGDIRDISSLEFVLEDSRPDIIFHLASQSFVQTSFANPTEVAETNTIGTANLLEAVRVKKYEPKVIFAGSSEEYGLVIVSEEQRKRVIERYGQILPEPQRIPELPINEDSPLRPMSPYAVTKVYGDYLTRNYYHSYGMKTVVSRGFNHEGAGRGPMFVTSIVTNQVAKLKLGETDRIIVGNVNSFRDWSYVEDIVRGYCLLAEVGESGNVYNQGSQRTNSVLSYILLTLEEAGYNVQRIETFNGQKKVENPTDVDDGEIYSVRFEKTLVDKMLLADELEYTIGDKGIKVYTDKGEVIIEFDEKRFRPADVPILLSDTSKIRRLGFKQKHTIRDIIRDQLNYFLDAKQRSAFSG
jgi:GDPmannose 4,6-dehydratase